VTHGEEKPENKRFAEERIVMMENRSPGCIYKALAQVQESVEPREMIRHNSDLSEAEDWRLSKCPARCHETK